MFKINIGTIVLSALFVSTLSNLANAGEAERRAQLQGDLPDFIKNEKDYSSGFHIKSRKYVFQLSKSEDPGLNKALSELANEEAHFTSKSTLNLAAFGTNAANLDSLKAKRDALSTMVSSIQNLEKIYADYYRVAYVESGLAAVKKIAGPLGESPVGKTISTLVDQREANQKLGKDISTISKQMQADLLSLNRYVAFEEKPEQWMSEHVEFFCPSVTQIASARMSVEDPLKEYGGITFTIRHQKWKVWHTDLLEKTSSYKKGQEIELKDFSIPLSEVKVTNNPGHGSHVRGSEVFCKYIGPKGLARLSIVTENLPYTEPRVFGSCKITAKGSKLNSEENPKIRSNPFSSSVSEFEYWVDPKLEIPADSELKIQCEHSN